MKTTVAKQAPETVATRQDDGWVTKKTADDRVSEAGTKIHEETTEGRREDKEKHVQETMRKQTKTIEGEDFRVREKHESYTYAKSG
jgi:hypothetical protein